MKRNTMLFAVLPAVVACTALSVVQLGATSGNTGVASERDDDARTSLLKADLDFSRAEYGTEAHAEFLSPDVWLLAPDVPRIRGREAFLAAAEALQEMDLAFSPDEAMVSEGGDLGITIGTFQITDEGPDGEPLTRTGKYKTTWQRRDDDRWWVVADMFNFDAPMPIAD